uniref:Uncharacterized protein n=1 Tax=uncultured bacterium CBNPD1 BAC clone 2089 TaxID=417311 RepID=B1N6P3_9BACT|nr:conserved hypothetical protein [uncultured bacterium CBNPD1 BAC clone 2089]
MAVAEIHEAMVEVALVRGREALAFVGTADDCEQHVENGDAENEKRDEERGKEEVGLAAVVLRRRVGTASDDARRHREHEPQQQGSAVPHEDFRRVEIVRQKSDARTARDGGDERADVWFGKKTEITEMAAVHEERRRCDGDDARRQAVETIDQVDSLGHDEQPQNGDEGNPVARQHEDVEVRNAEVEHRHTRPHENDSGHHRARDFRRCRNFADVVDESKTADEDRCQHDAERLGVTAEQWIEPVHLPGQQQRNENADQECDAPDVWRWVRVHLAGIGLGHPLASFGEPHHDGGCGKRRKGRRKRDDDVAGGVAHSATRLGLCSTQRVESGDRVDGEPRAKCRDAGLHVCNGRRIGAVAQRRRNEFGDLLHLGFLHSLRGDRRCTDANAGGDEWAAWIVRDGVLVEGDSGLVEHELGFLARELCVEGREVNHHHVVVGSTRDEAETLAGQCAGERACVLHDLVCVVAEHRRERLAERDGLGSDGVFEWSTLGSGEDSFVDLLGVFGLAEDASTARTAQRLVRGESDDVGIRHGVRVCTTGDEAGQVGDVEHQQCTDFVGDLLEGFGLEASCVRRRARHDHLRPVLQG